MPGPEIDNAVDKENNSIENNLLSGKPENYELRRTEYELKVMHYHELRKEFKNINKEILEKYKLNTFNMLSLCFINDSNELQMKDGVECSEGENTYIMVNGEKVYKRKEGCNGVCYYFDGEEFNICYYKNGAHQAGCYSTVVGCNGSLFKGTFDEDYMCIDGRKASATSDRMYDIKNGAIISDNVKYNVDKFYKAVDGKIDSVNPYQEPNTEIEQQENKLVL